MTKRILFSFLMIALLAVSASAQQHPNDEGAQDSIYIRMTHQPDVLNGDSLLTLEVYVFNDAQNIVTAGCGFSWDHDGLVLDSASFTMEASIAFFYQWFWYKNVIDSANAYNAFQWAGARQTGDGLVASATTRPVASYWFHFDSLLTNETVTIDSFKFSGATRYEWYEADFTMWIPHWGGAVEIRDYSSATDLGGDILPTAYALEQNYPNPFNPSTSIRFDLPELSKVNLSVYNVLGQKVATLVDETMGAGSYEKDWLGMNDGGSQVASGIYFYRLEANGSVVDTKKMMLLK